jgi:hypothetical protein
MQQPNWFDKKHEKGMERATAEEAMQEIANDDRIVKAVADALVAHDLDERSGNTGPGPSRSQSVRAALVEALQAVG